MAKNFPFYVKHGSWKSVDFYTSEVASALIRKKPTDNELEAWAEAAYQVAMKAKEKANG